jgi:hypothetical protein
MTPPVQPGVEALVRKPNMVATLLRDDTNHISLLSLSIFFLFCATLRQTTCIIVMVDNFGGADYGYMTRSIFILAKTLKSTEYTVIRYHSLCC